MPSAADNVKVEGKSGGKNHPQQAPVTDNGLPESTAGLNMFKQGIILMEHKIRNLEKRKSKLESYRDLQKAGKELNADQKTAVAKYDEVTNTLEFARDLCKQFLGFSNSSEKEAKKQAKREAAQRSQAELARIREIILVQDALDQMGNDNVREDFLAGRGGAAKLTEEEMKLLDDIFPVITPKHVPGNPTAFSNEVQGAAEHLLGIVEGKQKEVCGGTYAQIKEILGKIHESGYFDQAQPAEGDPASEELLTDIPAADQTDVPETYSREDPSDTQTFVSYNASSISQPIPGTNTSPECQQAEGAGSGTARERHSSHRPGHLGVDGEYTLAHQPRQGGSSVETAAAGAAPPSAIDDGHTAFYRPATTHHQAPKPISDLVGKQSYIFLQESEIDESSTNNTCPTAGTGPAAATATNGVLGAPYYPGQLPAPHALPGAPVHTVTACEISGGGSAISAGPGIAAAPGGGGGGVGGGNGPVYPTTAALQRTAGVVPGPAGAASVPMASVPMASTNGTSSACPAPPTNRRGGSGGGGGGGGGGAAAAAGGTNATQSSYYTSSTMEHERAGPNFVPPSMGTTQQHNANAHGSQTGTAGPATGRSSYYNATADRPDRSFNNRNHRSNQGGNNSRGGLECGFYSSEGADQVASSNRTGRGGPAAGHSSYYQNNSSHGYPKNGTRGQQQRSGNNSRSNKIQ